MRGLGQVHPQHIGAMLPNTCDVTIVSSTRRSRGFPRRSTHKVCLAPIIWAASAGLGLTHPIVQNVRRHMKLGGTWANDEWVFIPSPRGLHSSLHIVSEIIGITYWIMTHHARKGNGTGGHLVYWPSSPKLFLPLSPFSIHIWDIPHWSPIEVTAIWFYFILLFHPPLPFVFSFYIILTGTWYAPHFFNWFMSIQISRPSHIFIMHTSAMCLWTLFLSLLLVSGI